MHDFTDIFNMLDFIHTATDTNKGNGWNYSKRKREPVFKNWVTANQHPRAHYEECMISGQETVFC